MQPPGLAAKGGTVTGPTTAEVSAQNGAKDSYGLHAGVLGPLETLAQSVSAMAPSTSPSLTIPLVMEDTKALLAYAETQKAANIGIVGAVGYCMSGQYAVNAATHFPGRVKAAASIYGVQLATDRPDSPHLAGQKTRADLYFGCAETDVYAPMELVEKVRQQMKADGANVEVEIYPGTHHGFAFPKRPVYDRDAAERHWERLLALYRRNLSA